MRCLLVCVVLAVSLTVVLGVRAAPLCDDAVTEAECRCGTASGEVCVSDDGTRNCPRKEKKYFCDGIQLAHSKGIAEERKKLKAK